MTDWVIRLTLRRIQTYNLKKNDFTYLIHFVVIISTDVSRVCSHTRNRNTPPNRPFMSPFMSPFMVNEKVTEKVTTGMDYCNCNNDD
jgi:hypothetical protein